MPYWALSAPTLQTIVNVIDLYANVSFLFRPLPPSTTLRQVPQQLSEEQRPQLYSFTSEKGAICTARRERMVWA